MICNKCGTTNDPSSNFCCKCGNSLTAATGDNQTITGNMMYQPTAANTTYQSVVGSGMNPMLQGNGMMQTPNRPIKPRKSYTGWIILLAALSVVFMVFLVLVLFIVNKGSEEIVETVEEKVTAETNNKSGDDTIDVDSDIYKRLEGGWNSLDEDGSYWVFEDGEYWWYKSYEDLNDNYWYGTTEIIIGLDGIEKYKLNVDGMKEEIINGELEEEDIYTIICTPKKIISGGVDKSDTNIPEGQTLAYVWILVDKGEEGLQAETLHLSSYDFYYYKKIEE